MSAGHSPSASVWPGLLVAARLQYWPGAVVLYGIGTLLASGTVSGWRVALGVVLVSLVHVITHYVNDAEDVATDEATAHPTFATGGSRAIQRGLVTPAQLLRASAALAASALVGVAVLFATGHAVEAGTHLAILTLGYAYSGRPFTLGRRLLGELDAAVVMGLLLPLAGALAAGGPSSMFGPLAAVFVAQTFLGRLSTAWPDIDADRATQKWTITALLGTCRSMYAFVAVGLVMVALAELAVDGLPSPLTMRLSAWTTALAAFVIAGLVGTSKVGGKRAVIVPIVALAAYAVSLTAITAALWLPGLELP